jgi:hypothetical protein
MSRPQKSQLGGWLNCIAFIAKNCPVILQQNPEFLLPALVLLGIGIAGLVGAL